MHITGAEWIHIPALTLLSPENPLLDGARRSRKLPHIFTLLLLPPIILLAFSLIGGIILKAASLDALDGTSLGMAFVYQNLDYIVPFGLMIAVLAAWVLLREKRPLSTLGFGRKGAALKYLAGMAGGAVLYLVCVALLVVTGAVRLEQALEFRPFQIALVLFGLLAFVVQGAAEEILFRGWQMPAMAVRYGVPVAIVLSSLMFMAVHLIADVDSVYAFLFVFMFAIFLALYALYDKSLWGVCGFHAVWNWMDTNPFGLASQGSTFSTSLFSYTITGDLYYFVNIAVVLLGILVILALSAAGSRKKEAPGPQARQDATK